jgi:sarcosine oxidase
MRRLRGVRTTYDVLVVGGGVMGAWTAAIAARRGATVALADQFEPVHARGSSHGDGRIFRLAYHQDHYVDMMLHSLPLWQQLQDFAGEPLMATTGGMNIASVRGGVEGTGALADL